MSSNPSLYGLIRSLTFEIWDGACGLHEEVDRTIDWDEYLKEQGYVTENYDADEWEAMGGDLHSVRQARVNELMEDHVDYIWVGEGRHESWVMLLKLLGQLTNLQCLNIWMPNTFDDGSDSFTSNTTIPNLDGILDNLKSFTIDFGNVFLMEQILP